MLSDRQNDDDGRRHFRSKSSLTRHGLCGVRPKHPVIEFGQTPCRQSRTPSTVGMRSLQTFWVFRGIFGFNGD